VDSGALIVSSRLQAKVNDRATREDRGWHEVAIVVLSAVAGDEIDVIRGVAAPVVARRSAAA
jgi:hypothetical protein